MSEIHFMTAEEANNRALRVARWMSAFLVNFNEAYPDPDAQAVTSQFDYFTPNYISQTCASAIAEKCVLTTARLGWRRHDLLFVEDSLAGSQKVLKSDKVDTTLTGVETPALKDELS